MPNWIRKILKKRFLAWVLGSGSALTYFRIPIFDDWWSTMNFLVDVDLWIIRKAAYPGLFIVFFSLFLGTIVIPWLLGVINHHQAIRELWKLRSDGISFRNDATKVSTEDECNEWRQKYDIWRKAVLHQAKKISVNFHGWLDRLNLIEAESLPLATLRYRDKDGHFFAEYKSTCEILVRIERYLLRESVMKD